MRRINRRGFLKKGMAGAAAIVSLTPVVSAATSSLQDKKIIYRTLGKTGIKVPIVSMGVMNSENPNLCKAAYENGMTFFDTANVYQNGRNEEMLGNFFKPYPRNSFILATKVGLNGPDEFLAKFNISLKRLQMDYVDILYLHGIDKPDILNNPIVDLMKKLKKEGRTKFIGFSTHRNMAAMINAAATSDNWDVILTSYNFKLTNIEEMNSALKNANKAGIGIVAMKTLPGGGFLDKEKTKPMNTSAALKWVLSNSDVHTAIPGMTSFDQLDLNVKVMGDLTLTDQDKKDIQIAQVEPGLFCPGCEKCISACPYNLPVPDLMRAYMYAYGYSNMKLAHSLLSDLGKGADPCKDCGTCLVDCSRNFRVKEKITDISRLVNVPKDFII
jgi:uncharacterized protein